MFLIHFKLPLSVQCSYIMTGMWNQTYTSTNSAFKIIEPAIIQMGA